MTGRELQAVRVLVDQAKRKRLMVAQGPTSRRSWGVSRFHGVSWESDRAKWVARFRVGGRTLNLGRFDSEERAADVVAAALAVHEGRFA